MKIAIGADHGGFELKEKLIKFLRNGGHGIKDFGTASAESCDYPAVGYEVAKAVADGRFERGLLICKSGLGMCMVANKVPGIRAANIPDKAAARSSREHNDANVAVLAGARIKPDEAVRLIEVWLTTGFAGGRHRRRVDQITEIERKIAKK